ncbi:carbohydrate binding domain-containing protein [Streptomyces sp. NPDC005227]|uniref:carbohydrate binding domain-containing protein n=1 Tax=Streptomyces sp. NPDC005227 TaxID=3364707 RepID=UPI003675B26D
MVFPQTLLPLKVELQVGSTWTDVSGDVRQEQQIRIQRGRSDEGQQVDATRCSFTLDNNSGKYSPRNAAGPYYGSIGRNTPCRVSVLTGTPYLDLPGLFTDYAGTPDVAALDITGDLDVRLDMTIANWLPGALSGISGTAEWIGKLQSASKSWFLGARSGRLYFEWSADGTNSLSASSTVPPIIPGAGGRLAVRATLDVNNGAGGNTVTFYTADNLDAPWTQLGDPIVQSGTTSIFNSTAPLRVGNPTDFGFALPVGRCHGAEVRNGLWGTVVAQPRFDQQTVGTTSFADSAGRTWTLAGSASITNRQTRFVGEVSSWAVRWETKFDVVTQVDASGIIRRLTQGASPVRSPMFREFTNPSRTGIVAYWPMEDDASAATFGSALGQPAMTRSTGGVTLATFTGWAASTALPTFTYGTARARVAPYATNQPLFTRFFVQVPAGGVTGTDRLFSIATTGTARTWSLFVNTSGSLELRAYDPDGTQILASGFAIFNINGLPRHVGVELTPAGADVNWKIFALKIDETSIGVPVSSTLSGTLAGNSCGNATEIRIGQDGLLNGTAIGHVAVANNSNAYAATTGAAVAWQAEAATARVFRLGQEEGFPAYPAAISDQTLGVQGTVNLIDLLREAEAADEGVLCEERSFLGFRFRDRASLYNQKPAITLDYTSTGSGLVTPLEPTDDDQAVRNDITVARSGGSSTRLTQDTGTLSTLAPPSGVGRYADSITLNLSDDSQTGDHAGWRLHMGTWDETRYPTVRVMLAKAPNSLERVAALDIGDRFQITNPPAWLPLDTIDLMVQGYTETLDQFTWNLDFNCAPAGPWDVAWAGSYATATSPREFAWQDTTGSALTEDLTSSEVDVDVTTSDGPLWSPNVRDTPFDWRVGGEVMTVTAPHTLLNPNPFFDSNATSWTAQSTSMIWSQDYVHPHPRAYGSLKITPDGVTATGGALGDFTAVGSITPGAVYVLSGWVFSVNGSTDIQVAVNWYDAGGTLLSSATGSSSSASASVWTWLEQQFTAPASASRAKVRIRHGGTPPASQVYYVWAARITRLSSSWIYDQFGRTAASSWGTADSSQLWQVSGGTTADFAVGSGYGSHALATANVSRRSFTDCLLPDVDVYVDVTSSATATGGSLMGGPTARYIDSDNLYMARVEFTTAGAVILSLRKRVATVETQLATLTLEQGAGVTYTAGTYFRVRLQTLGTTVRAKCWRVGNHEPEPWQLSVVDTSLTTSSYIGLRSISATGNTNVGATVRYQNLALVNPQSYLVTRSQNRVVKAQTAGAPVALAYPTYTAL